MPRKRLHRGREGRSRISNQTVNGKSEKLVLRALETTRLATHLGYQTASPAHSRSERCDRRSDPQSPLDATLLANELEQRYHQRTFITGDNVVRKK